MLWNNLNFEKNHMKVLVTGSKGYIGSVLTDELIKKKYDVVGLDTGYFLECAIDKIEENY